MLTFWENWEYLIRENTVWTCFKSTQCFKFLHCVDIFCSQVHASYVTQKHKQTTHKKTTQKYPKPYYKHVRSVFIKDWHLVSEIRLHQIWKSGFRVPKPVTKYWTQQSGYPRTRVPPCTGKISCHLVEVKTCIGVLKPRVQVSSVEWLSESPRMWLESKSKHYKEPSF